MLTPGMAAAHRDWLSRASRTGTVVAAPGDEDATAPFAVIDDDTRRRAAGGALRAPTVLCTAPVEQYVRWPIAYPAASPARSSRGDSAARAGRDSHLGGRLAQRAGRIVFNGVPTGVAVTDAMHHGGPWPAASNSRYTSVGTHAIDRFVRPVALQGAPSAIAPYIA